MDVKQSPFATNTICNDSLLEDMRATHLSTDKDSMCNDSMADYHSVTHDQQMFRENDFDNVPVHI